MASGKRWRRSATCRRIRGPPTPSGWNFHAETKKNRLYDAKLRK
jgi:hypothetical protein